MPRKPFIFVIPRRTLVAEGLLFGSFLQLIDRAAEGTKHWALQANQKLPSGTVSCQGTNSGVSHDERSESGL